MSNITAGRRIVFEVVEGDPVAVGEVAEEGKVSN